MLEAVFAELGPWNWMAIGFALLALEIVVPGFFLLWIGIAALLTGALSLQLWGWSFWVWQLQVLVFLALSLVAAFVGNKLISRNGETSDQPLLNRRAEQFVGRVATLAEEANHHPDFLIEYDRVTLTLTSHDSGGLTERDFRLARKIDG